MILKAIFITLISICNGANILVTGLSTSRTRCTKTRTLTQMMSNMTVSVVTAYETLYGCSLPNSSFEITEKLKTITQCATMIVSDRIVSSFQTLNAVSTPLINTPSSYTSSSTISALAGEVFNWQMVQNKWTLVNGMTSTLSSWSVVPQSQATASSFLASLSNAIQYGATMVTPVANSSYTSIYDEFEGDDTQEDQDD